MVESHDAIALKCAEKLLQSGDDDLDATFSLLDAVFQGASLDHVRSLLRSGNVHAVRSGAFVASELAARARPVRQDLARALEGWSDSRVRLNSIDALLLATDEHDADILGLVLSLVRDDDPAIRWNVADFLARATPGQLRAAEVATRDSEAKQLAHWLNIIVDRKGGCDVAEIRSMFTSDDAGTRAIAWAAYNRFGLATAGRIGPGEVSSVDVREWLAAFLDAGLVDESQRGWHPID